MTTNDRDALGLDRRKIAAMAIAVFCVTLAVFWPATHNEFVNWDDRAFIVHNEQFRGFGWSNLKWMFTRIPIGLYQPLAWLSLAVDFELWGMNPGGYHLSSILLHCLNAALFFLLARRLLALGLGRGRAQEVDMGALVAALFFSLHPLRVESAVWISERRDVLSGTFYLLTLLLYLRAAERSARGAYPASLAAFSACLLSKGTAITLPICLSLLDFYPLRRLSPHPREWIVPNNRRVWLEKIPYWLAAIPIAVIGAKGQLLLQSRGGIAVNPPLPRLALALSRVFFYLGKTAWPARLSPVYDMPFNFNPFAPKYALSAAALCGITAVLWRQRARWPWALAAWACYLVVLLPLSGLFLEGPQVAVDRYTYFSCLPWALLVGASLAQSARKLEFFIPSCLAAAVLLTVLSLRSRAQILVWHDSEALWRHAISISPSSPIVRNNLANTLVEQQQFDEAIALYESALKIDPGFPTTHYNLAKVLSLRRGRIDAVQEHAKWAIRVDPNYEMAYNTLAATMMLKSAPYDAVALLKEALKINVEEELPGSSEYRVATLNNLGNALTAMHRLGEAHEYYVQALKLNPWYAGTHYNLGLNLAHQKLYAGAVNEFAEAVRLNPAFKEAQSNLDIARRDFNNQQRSRSRSVPLQRQRL